MTAGPVDLRRNDLKFGDEHPVDVEIRISRKTNTAANVIGRVVDAWTGLSPIADRVQICCFGAGPFERTSTELHADGSFEFSDVPPGRYEMELKGKTTVRIVNPVVEVGNLEPTRLNLVSAQQFVNLSTFVTTDGTVQWPQGREVSIAFAPSSGQNYRITSTGKADEVLGAFVPMGVSFGLSIVDLPAGLRVKSMSGTDSRFAAPATNSPAGYVGAYTAAGPSSILIILTRSD
jgi:hypothetical protein